MTKGKKRVGSFKLLSRASWGLGDDREGVETEKDEQGSGGTNRQSAEMTMINLEMLSDRVC